MIQLDIRSRNRTEKSDFDFQGCQESDSHFDSTPKPPTPYDSDFDSDSATLLLATQLIWLHN